MINLRMILMIWALTWKGLKSDWLIQNIWTSIRLKISSRLSKQKTGFHLKDSLFSVYFLTLSSSSFKLVSICSRYSWMFSLCGSTARSEEHTSELQSRGHLVCRLLLEKIAADRPYTNP